MLYKYFSFNENSLSCLINSEVWASNPNEFNDPFDSLLTIDFKNDQYQAIFEKYVQTKAVCCFSKNYTNILMWSHYADHHKGFCIGIDWPELEMSDILSPVNYSDRFLEVDKEEFLRPHEDGTINKQWERILTQKYIDWKYEEEIRLILDLTPGNKGKSFPLTKGVITEMYFGCRMQEKKKDTIKKILQENNVKFFNMSKSINDFSLEKTNSPFG